VRLEGLGQLRNKIHNHMHIKMDTFLTIKTCHKMKYIWYIKDKVLSQHFPGGTEENHNDLRTAVFRPIFEPTASRAQI
jgi:hypothetical protein